MPESRLGLEGKVAVVTGGGGTIGRATSVMLAQAGAHVLVVDLDPAAAEASAAAAGAAGAEAAPLAGDMRLEADVERMVAAAHEHWGRLDVSVNIVGGSAEEAPILELSDEAWRSVIDVNLFATVRSSRAAARAMVESGTPGSIVNIASPAAFRGVPNMAAYGAAKAAVINFTWTLAVELAPKGIRANVVVPAFVPRTDGEWWVAADKVEAMARATVPMGRPTRPEDVAGAILCFASDLTSFSTGQVLVCDGGRLLTNPVMAVR